MALDTERGVEEEDWFHGLLPRDEVQRLLMDEGDYLVRVSVDRKTGARQYVLSVRSTAAHKHFIIQGSHEVHCLLSLSKLVNFLSVIYLSIFYTSAVLCLNTNNVSTLL